jgi:hypothetical protein
MLELPMNNTAWLLYVSFLSKTSSFLISSSHFFPVNSYFFKGEHEKNKKITKNK